MTRFRAAFFALLQLAFASGCDRRPETSTHAAEAPTPASRLVVMITVDQLRGDYLERFQAQWRGGFDRLVRDGALFPAGQQDHAITETAPGHSTVLSGRDPAHTGIVTNRRGVPDSTAPLVGIAGGRGASPRRFRGTTLVDWLLARDSATRILSISGKDRGAILPIGRAKTNVFWYSHGRFVTSRYYFDALPPWIDSWNRRGGADRLGGSSWQLLLPDSAYREADSMAFENSGKNFLFPHRLATSADSIEDEILSTPYFDSLTLDLGLDGARQLRLGQRDGTDLLAISLSATDYIGHEYGPDSREIHDHLLRLDHWLGWFLDSLSKTVRPGQLLVALTADHGVTSFPEYAHLAHRPGGRVGTAQFMAALDSSLTHAGAKPSLEFESGLLLADLAPLRAAHLNLDSLSGALAKRLAHLAGIAEVYTPGSLARAAASDIVAARWRRQIPADVEWLICASPDAGYIWDDAVGSTTHGTTNQDDVEVPIAFMGPGVIAGVFREPVRTVDIAPTLAALLGVKPLEPLDGVVLVQVLGKR